MVASAAALVFDIVLGTITVVEVVARRPVAALVGNAPPQEGGTTVGALLKNAADDALTVSRTNPASPTPGITPTVTPNGTLVTSAPTQVAGSTAFVSTAPASTAVGGGSPTPTPSAPAQTTVPARTPTATALSPQPSAVKPTTANSTPQPPAAKSTPRTANGNRWVGLSVGGHDHTAACECAAIGAVKKMAGQLTL